MFRGCKDITRVPTKCCESANNKGSPDLPIYSCEFCGEGWHSETEVHIHKKTHLGEVTGLLESDKQLCYSCIKTFDTESALVQHVKTFHLLSSEDAQRVEREVFICDSCEQIFLNKTMLITHLGLCHKVFNLWNQKVKCPKSTCRKHVAFKRIQSHLYFHYLQSIMSCPICFHKCCGLTEYQAHAKMHKKYLYCDICGATFKDSIYFKEHITGHSNNPPIEQDKDLKFSRFFSPRFSKKFVYKKISSHRGYRLQKSLKICILCREICTNAEEANNHILRHYVLKSHRTEIEKTNHNCEKCGVEFTHKILLKQHKTKCEEVHVDQDSEEEENIEKYELSSNEEYEVIQIIE